MNPQDTPTVSKFYSDDHNRLDELFVSYQNLKEKDWDRAKDTFHKFKSGLEQHMAWEEAILFSEYEQRTNSQNDGPTEELRLEHEEIRDNLEIIARKLREGDRDTDKVDARLGAALASHNFMEEDGFYSALDRLLSDLERADIFKRMKDSAFEGD